MPWKTRVDRASDGRPVALPLCEGKLYFVLNDAALLARFAFGFFVLCRPLIAGLSVGWYVCGRGIFSAPSLVRCLALSDTRERLSAGTFQCSCGGRNHNHGDRVSCWAACGVFPAASGLSVLLTRGPVLWLQRATPFAPHLFFFKIEMGMRPNKLKHKNFVFESELPKAMVVLTSWYLSG